MLNRIILFLFCSILFNCCNAQQNNNLEKASETLKNSRGQLPTKLTKHFPGMVISQDYKISLFTDTSENNVGLVLYNYGLQKFEFDSILKQTLNLKCLAKYNSNDTCLLIVNKNQIDVFEKPEKKVDTNDSIISDDKCDLNKYPIPNFIGNNLQERVIESSRICKGFEIIVLEARPTQKFKEFPLKKNPTMPEMWSNGYSFGICYNKESSTFIYWSILW